MIEHADSKLDFSNFKRQPRHAVLARELEKQISSGKLQPGDRLPSFTELRERWSVGRDTLEQMYQSLESDGLIERQHRRGVFVCEPQKTKKTGTVGFISSWRLQNHPYYAHLLKGVRREAENVGAEYFLLSDKESVRWEKVDGVLYQATMHGELTMPPGMPRVALIYARPHADSAVADDYSGFWQAMEHLFELGHRRIAFLTLETQSHAMSHQRTAAYSDAFVERDLIAHPEWTRTLHEPEKTGRTWEQAAFDDMQQWLAKTGAIWVAPQLWPTTMKPPLA